MDKWIMGLWRSEKEYSCNCSHIHPLYTQLWKSFWERMKPLGIRSVGSNPNYVIC